MRLDKSRPPFQIAGFVFEFVRAPIDAVVAPFHDDLKPRSGHHLKQAVTIERPQRLKPLINPSRFPWHPNMPVKHRRELNHRRYQNNNHQRHHDKISDNAQRSPSARRSRGCGRRTPFRRQTFLQRCVIEQRQAQHHRQQIEKAIIAREHDEKLQRQERQARQLPRPAW